MKSRKYLKKATLVSMLFFVGFFVNTTITKAETVEALGWGWIGNSDNAAPGHHPSPGFISYNCQNYSASPCTNDYNVAVDTTAGTVEGWAWIGYTDATSKIGGIRFSQNLNNYLISTANYYKVGSGPDELLADLPIYVTAGGGATYDASGNISGWARIMELARYGFETYGSHDWGWIKLRGTWNNGSTSGEYGVSFISDYYRSKFVADDVYGKFQGWGWNDNGTDSSGTKLIGTGFGLINFDAGLTGSNPSDAWLQTQYGDVYSQNGISMTTSPTSGTNASYLILNNTGSIVNFDTSLIGGTISGTNYAFPTLDTSSTAYRSNIGKINITDLENSATAITAASELDSHVLNGLVYKTSGSFTIDTDLTIPNGIGAKGVATPLGNGTVIINGDLTIQNNIGYENSGSVAYLYNLASIVWIVKGNVIISPSVSQVAGNFVVLGNGGASVGSISTGAASNLQLTIYGFTMAHEFNLERQAVMDAGVEVPSEKIIYDGRALLNTPPGLEDLLATLPELKIANP